MGHYYEDEAGNKFLIHTANTSEVVANTRIVKQILRDNPELLGELQTIKIRDFRACLRVKFVGRVTFGVNHVNWDDVILFIRNGDTKGD